MANIFGFYIWGAHWRHHGEYDCIVRVRRRCGLMSNYFDHLFWIAQSKINRFNKVHDILEKFDTWL